jgi:uncharacterized damage-inducible protein DinB
MNDVLRDLYGHNLWANRTLLEYSSGLSSEMLETTDSAAYGNIRSTMQHVLTGESLYAGMFIGRLQPWDVPDAAGPSIDEMLTWTDDLRAAWETVLASTFNAESILVLRREGRPDRSHRAGFLITQALNHGNVHREQICHIITTLGLEPPDISGWRWESTRQP